MSTSNVMFANRYQTPVQEPDYFVTGRESEQKPYKFRNNEDLLKAQAEAEALVERLAEKHDWDEWASRDEFYDIIKSDIRLKSAVLHSIFDHLIATDPDIKKSLAKRDRAEAKKKARK